MTYDEAITKWFIQKYGDIRVDHFKNQKHFWRPKISEIIDPTMPVQIEFEYVNEPGWSEYTPGYTTCDFTATYMDIDGEIQIWVYERDYSTDFPSPKEKDEGFIININDIIAEVLQIARENDTQ
jgi:hypothetical protein